MTAIEDAVDSGVDEIGRFCADEGVDAGYVKGGSLVVARGPSQVPALEAHWESLVAAGRADHYEKLDAVAAAERVRVEGALGGVFGTQYASMHPGRLVRGLARAVERRGGTIHEQTAVLDVEPGAGSGRLRPALRTQRGELRATTVVLAGEAYLTQLRPWHRALLPTYSLIVLTEPLSDAQWATIGWRNRECVASYRLSIDYLTRTEDGRILFGGRGAPYRYGSRIEPAFDRDERTHAMLRRFVEAWFPSLAGIRFSHAWGGPLGFPRDWLPTFAYDPRTGSRLGPRLHRPRRRDGQPGRAGARRPHHRAGIRADRAAARGPPLAEAGSPSRSAGSACATCRRRSCGSTPAPSEPAARRRAGAWPSGSPTTDGRGARSSIRTGARQAGSAVSPPGRPRGRPSGARARSRAARGHDRSRGATRGP